MSKITFYADTIEQFSEMKKEEGRKEEKRKIAEKLHRDKYCCIKFRIACIEDCVNCLERYLEDE